MLGAEVPAYSLSGSGPAGDAAFAVAGAITGQVDIGGPGQNPGGVGLWVQVN